MSRLFRLWWLFCGILICTVVSFSALDLLQHLKGTSSPVHVGELFHPGPPALQPFNKLPVPAPRSNQKKTFVFTEHIAALWKLHEGKWSEFTSAASRQIVETCIPPPSKCDSNIHSSFPNYTFHQNIKTINYRDPALCVRNALSNVEGGPPRAVHYFWRAPIFHDADRILHNFKRTSLKWETRWSIGGIYPEIPYGKRPDLDLSKTDFLVWERYRESVAGRVTALDPHFSIWSEIEPYLLTIRNGIVGMNGAVADCHRQIYHFFPGACYISGDYMKEVSRALVTHSTRAAWDNLKSTEKLVLDRAFVIMQSYGDEFYHFLIECAPRLIFWRSYVIEHNMAVIVYQGGPWIHQFLRWAGIPEDKIVHASETPTLVRILHVPTPNPCLFSQGIYLRAMRDYVLSRMKPVLDEKRTILFISRKDASRGRGIVNEQEIIDAVAKRLPNETIKVFSPKDVTLAEQFQLFHAAKIVIGPHGAGFGNVIACQKDTKLLEVSNEMPRNFFLELAAKLNLEFHLVLGKSAGQPSRDSSVLVDAEQIAGLIQDLVEQGPEHLRTEENVALGSKIFVADDSLYPVCCKNTTWNIGY